ncbi:glycoside hydrolase family 16 protein [Salisediminibacterium beveridgei]|uniref:licheninase n=1 Tax=Salisediminibacterium beveridgei TaxID=632773 RepID=A0A1D7QXW9_9BACI|nr:glycoside hydrolase family 16 protein [Salisediminibacterium beveridgei]AOM83844.1 Xylanase/beta-glucanase [Salisediminibacterium beveridgei]
MKWIFSAMLLVILGGCEMFDESEEMQTEPETVESDLSGNTPFEIREIRLPSGTGYFGEPIHSSLTIEWQEEPIELWIGESIQDASGKWHDFDPSPIQDQPHDDHQRLDIRSENIPPRDTLLTGPQTHVVSFWDRSPDEEGAIRLFQAKTAGELILFSKQETFEQGPDTEGWTAADHQIGQTRFDPAQIDTHDEEGIVITMNPGGKTSGEIRTMHPVSYGSYEIAMTVPDNPGTLTGFFLYGAPDYDHEIDIEVMNDQTGEIWLTTYADGKEQHAYKEEHAIDPTDGIHTYRIDYFPDYTGFFLNGEELARFTDGYSHEPMQLMVNYWRPSWLDQTPADEDTQLHIHWMNH